MSLNAPTLATDIQRVLAKDLQIENPDLLVAGLRNTWCWCSWVYSLRHNTESGVNSFGLIAFGWDRIELLVSTPWRNYYKSSRCFYDLGFGSVGILEIALGAYLHILHL